MARPPIGTMRGPLGRATAAGALAAVGALAGCASSSPEPWDEPADYTYEATITVFGPSAGEWRLTVRDHDVVEAEPLDDTARISAENWGVPLEDFLTFAEYEMGYQEAKANGAAVARLERREDGALASLELDPDAMTADDEYLIVVGTVAVP